jgi:hypothetical protein
MATFSLSDFDISPKEEEETREQRILSIPKPVTEPVDEEEHSKFVLSEFYKEKGKAPLNDLELRAQVNADFGEDVPFKQAHAEQAELSSMKPKGPSKPLVIDPSIPKLSAAQPKKLDWRQSFKTRNEMIGLDYQKEVTDAKQRLGKGLSKEDRGSGKTDAENLDRYKENFKDWDDNSLHLKLYNTPLSVPAGEELAVSPERRDQMIQTLMDRDEETVFEDSRKKDILARDKTAGGHAAATILNVRDMFSYMAKFAAFGGANILLMGKEAQEKRAAGEGFIDPKTGDYILSKEQQGEVESYIKGSIDGAINYTIEKNLAKVGGLVSKGAQKIGLKNPLAGITKSKAGILATEIRKTVQKAVPKKAGAISAAATKISKKAGLNSLVEEIFVEEYLQALYEGIDDARSLTGEGQEQGLLKSGVNALKSVIVGTPEMAVTFGLFGLARSGATRQLNRESLNNAKQEWLASRGASQSEADRIIAIQDDKELGKEIVALEKAHLDTIFEEEAPSIIDSTGLDEEAVRVALMSSDPEVRKQNVAEIVEEQSQVVPEEDQGDASFLGRQDDGTGGFFNLYTLNVDIEGSPKGSTVGEATLRNAGIDIPEDTTPQMQPALEITEPQTAAQLLNIIKSVGGEDTFMESIEDKEFAQLALDAAGGSKEALDSFNKKIVGEELTVEDFPNVQEDAQQDVAVPQTQQVDEEDGQLLTGVSREFNNLFLAEMGRQELSSPDRISNVQTMQEALNRGAAAEADNLVSRILDHNDSLTQLSKDQVAGLLLRKVEIQNDIDTLQAELLDAADRGDEQAFDTLTSELDGLVNRGVQLTEAARRAGTENARALQAMAIVMDRKTFNLVNIIAEASRKKGAMLTPDQKAKFTAMATELKEWEGLATTLQAEVDALELQRAADIAAGVVVDELSKARASTKRAKTVRTREKAKATLEKLGYQVNDITGLPFAASKQIATIAVSYIQDGATTLEEVVSRVQADVPDVSPKNIYDALGGRIKKDAKRVQSEVEGRLTELKEQARLMGEIEEAAEGLLGPASSPQTQSDTVADLRKKLKTLSASVIQSDRDAARADAILGRITNIEEIIDGKAREEKTVRVDSKELKAAKSLLRIANKELAATDRIAVLKEILSTGERTVSAPKGQVASETSQRLESLRAQVSVLEGLLKEQSKENREAAKLVNIENRLADVVGEVEGVYRNIVEKKPKPDKSATQQEIEKYNQAKRDQDIIAGLLETLRTGVVKPTEANGTKSDPFGYKDMVRNLRTEIKNTEWYQEMKTSQREMNALLRTQENISQMEEDINKGNLDPYTTVAQQQVIKSEELVRARLREYQLKKEINHRIRDLKPKTWVDRASDIYDIPRTAKLTADVGHIWRQGGFFLSNPFKTNVGKFTGMSIKAFGETQADALDLKVLNSDQYVNAQLAGLHLISEGDSLDQREEILMDNMLDHMKGLGRPASAVIRASGRTQITSMNVLRMQTFEGMMRRAPNATAEEQKDFAWAINILTGYGQGENVDALARSKVLNKLLISTRFTMSRFQAPTMLFRPRVWKNKPLRKELIEDTLAYWALRGTIFFLAKSLWPDEVSIGTNPNHHTRGKLIVDLGNGQSRVYDPWSGMSKITNILAETAKGRSNPLVNTMYEITKSGHPMVSGLWGVATGTKYPQEESGRIEALLRMVTPISIEGFVDSYRDDSGVLDAFFSTALDIGGINSYTVDNEDLEGNTEWKDRKTLKESFNFGKKRSDLFD